MTWEEIKPMNVARLGICGAAAVLNGCIYVFGGFSGNHMNSVEKYDPKTDEWIDLAPTYDKYDGLVLENSNDLLLDLRSCPLQRYDPLQNEWHEVLISVIQSNPSSYSETMPTEYIHISLFILRLAHFITETTQL